VKEDKMAKYEIIASSNTLVLYFYGLKGDETKSLLIPATIDMKGSSTSTPSKAYYYYEKEESIIWTDPLKIGVLQ